MCPHHKCKCCKSRLKEAKQEAFYQGFAFCGILAMIGYWYDIWRFV